MTDIPIIFSAPMILALLDGRKTMTRRLAWQGNDRGRISAGPNKSSSRWQRVKPGDRLWVRENMKVGKETLIFLADNAAVPNGSFAWQDWAYQYGARTVPSIHMPRWASRLTLIVTATKIERLNVISEQDAMAEGIIRRRLQSYNVHAYFVHDGAGDDAGKPSAYAAFRHLWTQLHGNIAWDDNPEVVALTARVIKANIDAPEAMAA